MRVSPVRRSLARLVRLAFAGVLAASVPAAQSALWIVDDDGGPLADFTTIQAAVDVAADGDVVLVRAGDYGAFAIDGKGVSVVGELQGAVVVDEATVAVRNTPAGRSVLLQNLVVRGGPFSPFGGGERALVIEGCAGIVAAQDCAFLPSSLLHEGGGARVDGSQAVALTRCELVGGADAQVLEPGHALTASASSIAAYDCTLTGGAGPGGPCTFGCGKATDGGDGASLDASALFASGSAFAGGAGLDGDPACSIVSLGGEGANGGDGVSVAGGGALRTLACSFSHGSGGVADSPGSCASGVDGVDVDLILGTHVELPGIARSLAATSPIVEGGVTTLAFVAAPGDLAFVNVSLKPGFLALDPFQGVMLTNPLQFFTVFLGAIPASGTLVVPVQTVAHAPFGEVVVQHLQSGWFTTLGEIRLGSNASVVIEK